MTDFLNQIVVKGLRGGASRAFRFGISRCAERKRLEADLRVAAGPVSTAMMTEVALLFEQRGSPNAVKFGHFDIEHGDVGGCLDLLRRRGPAQGGCHSSPLGSDPARDHTRDHDGVSPPSRKLRI